MHYGIDFSVGSCAATSSGCLLTVTFAPQSPGSRSDAVIVKDGSGNLLTKAIIHGTGQGPLAVFSPGSVSVPFSQSGDFVYAVAVDARGTAYFSASSNSGQMIMKLDPGSTTPSQFIASSVFSSMDGEITSLAVDAAGNLYVVGGVVIEKLDGETVAMTSIPVAFSGAPELVATDIAGDLFVVTYYSTVHRIDAVSGAATLVAGSGYTPGNGGPAINAFLDSPRGIAVDAAGNLFLAETDTYYIRRVDAATQIINIFAGYGTFGYSGDGGAALAAQIENPSSLALDALGKLYFASADNAVVRKVDASTQIITTVAGVATDVGIQPEYSLSSDAGLLANNVEVAWENLALAVDPAGNPFLGNMLGDFVKVASSAPTLPFLPPTVSTAVPITESLFNFGNAPPTIGSVVLSGPFTYTPGGANPCSLPVVLGSETACQVTINYDKALGQANGSFTLIDNTVSTNRAILSLAYPQAALSGSLTFPSTQIGGYVQAEYLTLGNLTNAALSIQSVTFTGANAKDFAYDTAISNCGTSLAPRSSCDLYVDFIPTITGPLSATLVLNTNA